MLSRVYSGVVNGLEGVLVDVEVDVADRGFPTFTIVGLAAKSIDEAKERVRTAIRNTSFNMPDSRLTINLAPADIPKDGSGLDLPIAIGILASSGYIQKDILKDSLFLGEVSLEGDVRPVPGVISIALMARDKKLKRMFIAPENSEEALLVDGIDIFAVKTLAKLILFCNDQEKLAPLERSPVKHQQTAYDTDFAEIKGQFMAKRAFEIAAAGFHNIHLKGSPGAGKTMLSRAFPSILPVLTKEEILEVTKIHSVAGLIHKNSLVSTRPFRSPHHTTSRIGLIGGGTNPQPGEISLAHRGVLFLDEFAEFPRSVLESLRQPLEDGIVTISRAAGSITYPCRFLLVAASNPCPCGYLGHPTKPCKCMPGAIQRYRKRLSGPILDRIDLHVDVLPVKEDQLTAEVIVDRSSEIRQRVQHAHDQQKQRFKKSLVRTNAEMRPADIKINCHLSDGAVSLLKQAIKNLSLSARTYFKVIKIAQTISDLAGVSMIEASAIAEALQYRPRDEQ